MKNERKIKIVCIIATGVMGLVPEISYIQSPSDNHSIISELSSKSLDGMHKSIIPPLTLLDATTST